ncbi:hypothetical protein [Persephonella sp.]
MEIDKIRLIQHFSFAGIFVLLLVSAFHYLSGDKAIAVFELIIASGGALNLILLKLTGNVRLSENFILVGMVVLLTGILIHGGYERTGIYWIFTFPLLSFFFKGNKAGMLWSFGFVAVVCALLLLQHSGFIVLAYSYGEFRQAMLAYLIITILAYIFEDALQKSYDRVSKLAVTDQLTGLYNRRYLLKKMEE